MKSKIEDYLNTINNINKNNSISNNIEMIFVKGNNFINDFNIGKYPVTQKQWVKVMGNNPSHFKGDDLPVESVNWNDAQDFIKTLNQKTGKNYRLPTEAEWEYAARGGAKSEGYRFAGSDDADQVVWYSDNSGDHTHPVGLLKPNQLRLYDMSGNVWEWCADRYDDYPNSAQTVIRGGSWSSNRSSCQVMLRSRYTPSGRSCNVGFRLAL